MKKCMKDMMQEAEYEWEKHKKNYSYNRTSQSSVRNIYRTMPYPSISNERCNQFRNNELSSPQICISPPIRVPISIPSKSPPHDQDRIWGYQDDKSSICTSSSPTTISSSSQNSDALTTRFSFDCNGDKPANSCSRDFSRKKCSCCYKS